MEHYPEDLGQKGMVSEGTKLKMYDNICQVPTLNLINRVFSIRHSFSLLVHN